MKFFHSPEMQRKKDVNKWKDNSCSYKENLNIRDLTPKITIELFVTTQADAEVHVGKKCF